MLWALDILSLGRRPEPFYMLNSSFEKVLWRYLFEMEWTILNCFYGCLCSHLSIESNLLLLVCLDLDPVSRLVCLDQFIWYIDTCPFCLAAYKVFLWEPLELNNTISLLISAKAGIYHFWKNKFGAPIPACNGMVVYEICHVVCYVAFLLLEPTNQP